MSYNLSVFIFCALFLQFGCTGLGSSDGQGTDNELSSAKQDELSLVEREESISRETEMNRLEGVYQGILSLPGRSPVNFVLGIEQVSGNKIKGYNVAAGNRRSVSGFIEEESGGRYTLSLSEPGDKKTDGSFRIKLEKNGSFYSGSGTWLGYNKNTKADISLSSEDLGDLYSPLWMENLEGVKKSKSLASLANFAEEERGRHHGMCTVKPSITHLFAQMHNSKTDPVRTKSFIEKDMPKIISREETFGTAHIFGRIDYGHFEALLMELTYSEGDGYHVLFTYDKQGKLIDYVSILYRSMIGGDMLSSSFNSSDSWDETYVAPQVGEDGFVMLEVNRVREAERYINRNTGKIEYKKIKDYIETYEE